MLFTTRAYLFHILACVSNMVYLKHRSIFLPKLKTLTYFFSLAAPQPLRQCCESRMQARCEPSPHPAPNLNLSDSLGPTAFGVQGEQQTQQQRQVRLQGEAVQVRQQRRHADGELFFCRPNNPAPTTSFSSNVLPFCLSSLGARVLPNNSARGHLPPPGVRQSQVRGPTGCQDPAEVPVPPQSAPSLQPGQGRPKPWPPHVQGGPQCADTGLRG